MTAPLVARHGTTTVAIKGRPRIGDARFDAASIAGQVLSSYRDRGTKFLAALHGPFALAIVDARSGDALLAIDRMGIETLAWAVDDNVLGFGTSAASVARRRTIKTQVNPQALFDFMLAHMVAAPDTAFLGVSRLLPATCLELRDGRIAMPRYWEPNFRRERTDLAALRAEVLPTLRRAIDHTTPDDRTGTFLSGGLDSSTVTGLFAGGRTGRANAFSVAFGVDEFNELSYARIASDKFRCTHHVYEVVPDDVVELIPTIAGAYDEPFGNSSAVPTFCCARLAKSRDTDHLLAGDGGDELFGGNSRYVRHKVFELYQRLPRFIRRGIFEPLAAALDPESSSLPLRKFSSYVRQARVPLPERFESWNMIYREGPATVFDPDFLSSVEPDYPLARMRETWESCPSPDLLDRMLWYDWKFTLADNDLRKVSRACELAGVRVSYPMLDEAVVQLSIQVPSTEKISGSHLRTFFKDAVRDFLPSEIIAKEKHGFGLPFGIWLKQHGPLQQLVYGNLASLRERGILSRAFIDRVTSEHRTGHVSYYGYAIWDMVMLEHWLSAHRADA